MTSLQASSPGLYSNHRVVAGIVTKDTPTVDLEALSVGDVVIRAWCEVTQVFNATVTNVITLGDGTNASKYLAAADVTEGSLGATPAAGKGPFAAETVAGTLRATYAQTGTAATTGIATVYCEVINAPA